MTKKIATGIIKFVALGGIGMKWSLNELRRVGGEPRRFDETVDLTARLKDGLISSMLVKSMCMVYLPMIVLG